MYVDGTVINQILLNLLSNAIKFTPEKGKIIISAKMNGGKFYLSIADSGIGINSRMLKIVTEPFIQVPDVQQHSQKGTGLGLSIVKALVNALDGELDIQSEINKGTTVTVTLPMKIIEKG